MNVLWRRLSLPAVAYRRYGRGKIGLADPPGRAIPLLFLVCHFYHG